MVDRLPRALLAASAALLGFTLLWGATPSPIHVHLVFVVVYFLRLRFSRPARPWLRFVLAVLVSTWLLEGLAWFSSYAERSPEPALFHPQLIPDLTIATGFYFSWTLAWLLLLRRYRFSVLEVYIIQGIYGVFIEQQGAIFQAGLAQFPLGMIFWVYVFVAYGSTMALAYFIADVPTSTERKGWLKYPLALAAIFVFTFAISAIWGVILDALRLIPPKRPIAEHPFI